LQISELESYQENVKMTHVKTSREKNPVTTSFVTNVVKLTLWNETLRVDACELICKVTRTK